MRKWTAKTQEFPWPIWTSWPEFCDQLCRIRQHGHVMITVPDGREYECSERSWWASRWATKTLVVVDEIGTRTANDVRLEAMWRLMEARQGLPTIFTGNLSASELAATFDERIVSRLSAGTWIEVTGKDRRAEGFGRRSITV